MKSKETSFKYVFLVAGIFLLWFGVREFNQVKIAFEAGATTQGTLIGSAKACTNSTSGVIPGQRHDAKLSVWVYEYLDQSGIKHYTCKDIQRGFRMNLNFGNSPSQKGPSTIVFNPQHPSVGYFAEQEIWLRYSPLLWMLLGVVLLGLEILVQMRAKNPSDQAE